VAVVIIKMSVSEAIFEEVLAFCKESMDSWKQLDSTTVSVKQLTGNSNKVLLVETSEPISPSKLIFRYFGPDEVTDKRRERLIFRKLGRLGMGPESYGETARMRVEEFLEGFEPLAHTQIVDPNIMRLVTARLRQFHKLDFTDVIDKEPLITDQHPQKWREVAYNRLTANPNITERRAEYEEAMELLQGSNWDLYDSMLPRDSPVVFSHSDPSELNFLYNTAENRIYFVDFEFAGYSYRAMDMASWLNEAMSDYSHDQYPFFSYNILDMPSDDIVAAYVRSYGEGKEMFIELKRCLIAVHYLWALWSLASYKGDIGKYDYLGYALMRYRDFKRTLGEFRSRRGLEGLRAEADRLFPDS
jgi:thiamine kinase-like enzyme